MESRAEHLAWCKQRALEYADRGDIAGALASMGSDLRKHPDLERSADLVMLGMFENTPAKMRHFIEGFN